MRDINPSSILLSFHVASSPCIEHNLYSQRISCSISKPSLMNTPPIKNWWSCGGSSERMSPRQCHGVRSARNSRDVCIWDGERKDSRRLVSNFAQDIEIAAWNVPHVFSVSKEAVSLRLRPALSRARDRSGLVFGFRSFIFRSSGTAFDSAGREKRLVVILLQWQSFRDFTFPPKSE